MKSLVQATKPQIVAWTGGDRPRKRRDIGQLEKDLIHLLFRQQCYIFLDYWHKWFDDKWSVLRIFYNRARYDAHATIRAMKGGDKDE